VSFKYINPAIVTWRTLLKHEVCCAWLFALANAGSSNAAKMAIMATTTSNSMSVKARQVAEASRLCSGSISGGRSEQIVGLTLARGPLPHWPQ
jgi:hypothetical protein